MENIKILSSLVWDVFPDVCTDLDVRRKKKVNRTEREKGTVYVNEQGVLRKREESKTNYSSKSEMARICPRGRGSNGNHI